MYKSKYIEMFDGCEKMTRDKAIESVMKKCKISKATAQTYCYQWKKQFMNGANCVPKEYTIIAKDPKEPENDMKIECEDDTDMKIYANKCRTQGYEVQEAVTVQDIANMTKNKPEIKLMPVLVSGGYFIYRMDYDGVKIESGQVNTVTMDCIAEQEAALKLWKKYYSTEV